MSAKTHQPKSKKIKTQNPEKYVWLYISVILLLTFIIYFPVTKADFLNWDDINFVLGNDAVTSLSFQNIQKMFSSYAMGNYCPLSIFTYAVDYQLAGGLNAKVFHTTSLLIHLVNTFLVFVFIFNLSNKQVTIAAIVAVLFGIHPMHVESVAWVAERRDVLYTMFFLLGLISYLRFTASGFSIKHLIFASLFFIGALLSKGQAVTFSIVLFLIDYIQNRKWELKVFLEKIPFLILSLAFGYLAIVAQKTTPALNVFHLTYFNSFLAGIYGLLLYFIKAVIPFQLSGYHPYPFKINSQMPVSFYVAPFILAAIFTAVYLKLKSDRNIIGGLLIFLLTIFPVLQFLPVGQTIISERYTYIPYIGLFYVIGFSFKNAGSYKLLSGLKSFSVYILIGFVLVLSIITYSRVNVWRDSVSFWSDVILKYPENAVAYNSRGYMYNEYKKYNVAMLDFNKGISLDSTYGRIFLNRGVAYQNLLKYDLALDDYSTSIRLDSTELKTFLYRGILYTDKFNKPDSAIYDFNKVLQLNPENIEAITNLGIAFSKKGDNTNAIEQFNQSLKRNPDDGKVLYLRALSYGALKDYNKAIDDATKCKQLGFTFDESVLKEWENAK